MSELVGVLEFSMGMLREQDERVEELEAALLETLTCLGQLSDRESPHKIAMRSSAIANGWKALGSVAHHGEEGTEKR